MEPGKQPVNVEEEQGKINFIYKVNEDETRSGCNGKTVSDPGCHDKESD